MVKRYASFVLRCWRLETDERRIEVEHVQSGGRTRVRSLAEAMDWIDGCSPPPVAPTEPGAPQAPLAKQKPDTAGAGVR